MQSMFHSWVRRMSDVQDLPIIGRWEIPSLRDTLSCDHGASKGGEYKGECHKDGVGIGTDELYKKVHNRGGNGGEWGRLLAG
mmetsp:Transcript_21380/g.42830  ORF Transcript_21380/g.42830 Transcript_21380/m.42830 type:complete len:82 (+) Transcript_21380:221-466(+)